MSNILDVLLQNASGLTNERGETLGWMNPQEHRNLRRSGGAGDSSRFGIPSYASTGLAGVVGEGIADALSKASPQTQAEAAALDAALSRTTIGPTPSTPSAVDNTFSGPAPVSTDDSLAAQRRNLGFAVNAPVEDVVRAITIANLEAQGAVNPGAGILGRERSIQSSKLGDDPTQSGPRGAPGASTSSIGQSGGVAGRISRAGRTGGRTGGPSPSAGPGTDPGGQRFAEGGEVPKTGPATVHQGEFVLTDIAKEILETIGLDLDSLNQGNGKNVMGKLMQQLPNLRNESGEVLAWVGEDEFSGGVPSKFGLQSYKKGGGFGRSSKSNGGGQLAGGAAHGEGLTGSQLGDAGIGGQAPGHPTSSQLKAAKNEAAANRAFDLSRFPPGLPAPAKQTSRFKLGSKIQTDQSPESDPGFGLSGRGGADVDSLGFARTDILADTDFTEALFGPRGLIFGGAVPTALREVASIVGPGITNTLGRLFGVDSTLQGTYGPEAAESLQGLNLGFGTYTGPGSLADPDAERK